MMHKQVKEKMIINAQASKVWRILAHEFEYVAVWSSGLTDSMAMMDSQIPDGAFVGGRVCLSHGFGGDVEEAFTYYDEEGMRFGYQAVGDLPSYFNSAENNWQVQSLEPNKSLVTFKAKIDLN